MPSKNIPNVDGNGNGNGGRQQGSSGRGQFPPASGISQPWQEGGQGGQGRSQGRGQGQSQGQGQQGQGRRTLFNEGEEIRVWKPTGVRNLKYGAQTSERTGGDYPDISPDEPLLVIKRFGSGKAICRRPSGDELIVHANHVNPDSRYYTTRKTMGQGQGQQGGRQGGGRRSVPPAGDISPQERLRLAEERLRDAQAEAEAALNEVVDVAEELSQDLPGVEEGEGEEAQERAKA